jgi:hypothetical protein
LRPNTTNPARSTRTTLGAPALKLRLTGGSKFPLLKLITSCPATNALGLLQFGDVGPALVFRYLDERYLTGRHYPHLRIRGEIDRGAGAQIDAHLFAAMPEQIGTQRHVGDGDLVVARRQIAHYKTDGLTAGDHPSVDNIIWLDPTKPRADER